jgi:hypothetical protein
MTWRGNRGLRTIPRHSIPRLFRLCRAIKRYSVPWRNLAVVWVVRTVVDATLAVADDRIRGRLRQRTRSLSR